MRSAARVIMYVWKRSYRLEWVEKRSISARDACVRVLLCLFTHVAFSVLSSLSPIFLPFPCLPFPFLPFLSSLLLPFPSNLSFFLAALRSFVPSVLTLPRYPFAGCANPRVDVAIVFVDGAMEAMEAMAAGGNGGGGQGAAAGRAEPDWINIPDEEYLGTIFAHMYLLNWFY